MDWITIAMFILVAKPIFIAIVGFVLINKAAALKVHGLLTTETPLIRTDIDGNDTRTPF